MKQNEMPVLFKLFEQYPSGPSATCLTPNPYPVIIQFTHNVPRPVLGKATPMATVGKVKPQWMLKSVHPSLHAQATEVQIYKLR